MLLPVHRLRNLAKMLLVAAIGALLAGCQATLFTAINASARDQGVRSGRGIEYDASHDLRLDVYAPLHAHNAPVIVLFHGGSWQSGKRQWYRWLGERLAHAGVVVIIPDYRKYPNVRMDGFMRNAGEPVELHLYPGIGHVGLLWSLSRSFDYRAPALAAIMGFIASHPN